MKMKMKNGNTALLFWLTSIALIASGCGSSGSGGSANSGAGVTVNGEGGNTTLPFTSFSDLRPNTNYEADAISVGSSYTYDTDDFRVDSIGSTILDSSGTVTIGYGDLFLERFFQENSIASFSINSSDGDDIFFDNDSSIIFVSKDRAIDGIFMATEDLGWDYQTFGVWRTGVNTGSGYAGATSFGYATPISDIPISGGASYFGSSSGIYVDSDGADYFTYSNVSAFTDFSRQRISFETDNTLIIDRASFISSPDYFSSVSAPGLDFSGELSFDRQSGLGSGKATSISGLEGNINSRFYGPRAEEVGGVFELRGEGVEAYQGAFGASR